MRHITRNRTDGWLTAMIEIQYIQTLESPEIYAIFWLDES